MLRPPTEIMQHLTELINEDIFTAAYFEAINKDIEANDYKEYWTGRKEEAERIKRILQSYGITFKE